MSRPEEADVGLTPQQAEAFRQEGYVSPLRVLSREEAEKTRLNFERYEASLGGSVHNCWRFKSHLLVPWMADLVRHPALVAVVKSALGTEDVLCWSSDIFVKEPKDGKFTGWHQDSTYVAFSDPPDVLTVWVALSPSNPDSGCVRFWPGSHLKGQLDHLENIGSGSLLLKGQEVAVEVPEEEAVDACLEPGEASVHHIKTVHGSGPNLSDGRRIGIALRYMASSVKQYLPERDSVTLVAGRAPGDYYCLEPRPTSEFDKAALEAHRAAVGPVYPKGVEPPPFDALPAI